MRISSRSSSGRSASWSSLSLGRMTRADAGAVGGEDLLLDAADRQHQAGQRDLAGHGDVLADRPPATAPTPGPSPSSPPPTGRPWAPRRPARGCARRGSRRSRPAGRGPTAGPRARTKDTAAWADSRITSPSCPVTISRPLPGMAWASTKRISPPAPVTASPVATPGSLVRRLTSLWMRSGPRISRASSGPRPRPAPRRPRPRGGRCAARSRPGAARAGARRPRGCTRR